MELTTQKIQFDSAIDLLETNMKKKSKTLPSSLRKTLIKLLNKHADLVTVRRKRFIISVQFYPVWIKEFKLDLSGDLVDRSHYKFFRKLSKYGYTHPKSSYFPKKKALISLNPNLPSIYKGNLQNISKYGQAKKSLYTIKLSKLSSSEITSIAYTDLRLYQSIKLTAKEIESINTSNIFFTSKFNGYIYLEEQGIFDNITIPPYQLIRLQGKKLVKILKKFQEIGIIYPFIGCDLENQLSQYRKEFLPNLSMHDIRMATQNYVLTRSNPLVTTLSTSRSIISQLTIAEISTIYPSTVPRDLLKMEKKRIKYAKNKTKDIDEDDNFIDSSFSLKEFDYLQELLKVKNNSIFMKKIEPTKRELNRYIKSEKPEAHGILIARYIVHLLSSIDRENKDRHIVISTFRNYYSLIRTHLFDKIEDLSNVQTHEINKILQDLATARYSENSIQKIRSLITDFFKINGKKHNTISMNLASYPKSIVFESEIDLILSKIEDGYNDDKEEDGTDYKILRDKAIVLMARYSGLRKSELRSRLTKDVYIYNNELCIDVNSEGLSSLELRLKTRSAKRRVCTKIINKPHLEIIIKYIEARDKVKNKNQFFFLHVDDKNKIKPKVVVEEGVFNDLGDIIKEVTGRYTSFHSLRHTYATYAVRDILQCDKINPYKMIELSVKMGHTSPEITLKKYTHRSVIEAEGLL